MYHHSFTLMPSQQNGIIVTTVVTFDSENLIPSLHEFSVALRKTIKDTDIPYGDKLLAGKFAHLSHIVLTR